MASPIIAHPRTDTRPKRTKRREVPLSIRRELWRRVCVVCLCPARICVDHIVPVVKGGSNDPSNLQPLCWICNAIKGGRLMTNDQIRNRIVHRIEHLGVDRYFDYGYYLPSEWITVEGPALNGWKKYMKANWRGVLGSAA